VAAFVFLVGYVALNAISGVVASALLASGAPWSTQAIRALFALGPVALPTELALVAFLVAVLLAAWALYRAGRPLAPLVLLVATTIWLTQDHGACGGSSSSPARRAGDPGFVALDAVVCHPGLRHQIKWVLRPMLPLCSAALLRSSSHEGREQKDDLDKENDVRAPAEEHVTLVEVLEVTSSFEEFKAAIKAAARRLEAEGVEALVTLQFYADPGSTEAGAILTFSDRERVMEHIAMISGWEEFERFFATVRPVDVRVYGKLSAEAEAWVRQFGVVSRTFEDHVAGFVR
jgi:hypothetical protein